MVIFDPSEFWKLSVVCCQDCLFPSRSLDIFSSLSFEHLISYWERPFCTMYSFSWEVFIISVDFLQSLKNFLAGVLNLISMQSRIWSPVIIPSSQNTVNPPSKQVLSSKKVNPAICPDLFPLHTNRIFYVTKDNLSSTPKKTSSSFPSWNPLPCHKPPQRVAAPTCLLRQRKRYF